MNRNETKRISRREWNNDFVNLKEADDPRLAIVDSNLERQAVANYPVIRPSVSRVIRIIVGASVEINLYQFTAAMVHSNGCWWNWFSLPGDKSYPSTEDLPSRGGGGGKDRCFGRGATAMKALLLSPHFYASARGGLNTFVAGPSIEARIVTKLPRRETSSTIHARSFPFIPRCR